MQKTTLELWLCEASWAQQEQRESQTKLFWELTQSLKIFDFQPVKIASLPWIPEAFRKGTQVSCLGAMVELSLKLKGFTRKTLKNLKISLKRIDPIASNLTTWEQDSVFSKDNTKKWDIQQCNIWWFQHLIKNSLNIPRSRKLTQSEETSENKNRSDMVKMKKLGD